MAEMILFTGGKGGTGTSTICAITGGRISAKEKRVLVVEATLRSIDVLFDVSDKVVYDWRDAIEGRCTLAEAVVEVEAERDKDKPNCLSLLCAPTEEELQVRPQDVERLLGELGDRFDFIFVDLDGTEQDSLRAFAPFISYAIIVTSADRSGARRNERVSHLLSKEGMDDIRLCVNQLPADFIKQRSVPDLDWLIETVCGQLISVIPFDPILPSAPNVRYLVASSSKITIFFDNLAQRIMGNYIDLSVW